MLRRCLEVRRGGRGGEPELALTPDGLLWALLSERHPRAPFPPHHFAVRRGPHELGATWRGDWCVAVH